MKDRTIKGVFDRRIEGFKDRVRWLRQGLEEMLDQLVKEDSLK